eukprot:TRINITY_DN10045_c0_g1_i4.p1 TRINITY_DN10045_c0_g1~~TRINITY_DN10045_c0_g1_i4.p1  ORF type:complete len:183 (-),score=8.91 TRINITY_DN10045_c0_g1_i4:94-573(-)
MTGESHSNLQRSPGPGTGLIPDESPVAAPRGLDYGLEDETRSDRWSTTATDSSYRLKTGTERRGDKGIDYQSEVQPKIWSDEKLWGSQTSSQLQGTRTEEGESDDLQGSRLRVQQSADDDDDDDYSPHSSSSSQPYPSHETQSQSESYEATYKVSTSRR